MNTKRDPKCHLLNDWKEQIVHIGDEQTSLQNQFDVLRNDFSDNSPRILALETGLNSLDGRVIITESDIVGATQRITAAEADIDRIDAELVNKTGDINALTNRVSGAEADITAVDGRVTAIETGEILYSQLTMDADKDFAGKAIVNPGLVDGVDVGSHVHSGAVGSGAKINLKDVEVTEDKDFGGKGITNATGVNGCLFTNVSHAVIRPKLAQGGISQIGCTSLNGDTYSLILTHENGTLVLRPTSSSASNANIGITAQKFKDLFLAGNAYIDGVVDGVDVSEHVHDGTAIGGKKIPIGNIVINSTINMGKKNIYGVKQIYFADPVDESSIAVEKVNKAFKLSNYNGNSTIDPSSDDGSFEFITTASKYKFDKKVNVTGDIAATGAITGNSVSASGTIKQNNGMPVASCPTTFSKNLTNHNFAAGSQSVDLGILPSNRSGLSLLYVSSNLSNLVGDCSVTIKLEYDDGTQLSCMYSQDTTGTMQLEQASLMPYDDASAKKCIKKAIVAKVGIGTCTVNITATGLLY